MMLLTKRIVIAVMITLFWAEPSLVFAVCGVPKMSQMTMGQFKVVSTRPMSVPCVDSLAYFGAVGGKEPPPKSFIAPGCLLKVKRLTPPEAGFNNDETYDVYYEESDCAEQVGKRLTLKLGGQCCPERPLKCDQDPSKNKSETAAHGGELVCAAPHSGRWMIFTPASNIEGDFDILRKRYKEGRTNK